MILPPQNFNRTILFIGYDFILIQYLHKMWAHHCIKSIILSIRSTKGPGQALKKNREINDPSMIKHMWNYWNARAGPFLVDSWAERGYADSAPLSIFVATYVKIWCWKMIRYISFMGFIWINSIYYQISSLIMLMEYFEGPLEKLIEHFEMAATRKRTWMPPFFFKNFSW